MTRLTDAELRAALAALPSWRLDQGKLYRELRFADFIAAFAFMTKVALMAERMNHHPEWHNVYGSVRVWLTTHDSLGISAKDVALARAIDAAATAP
jgi:4a-hydroxytetrahydrobiopterin dehydratase